MSGCYMAFNPDIGVLKLLKALNNSHRLKIVELIINSSSASFSDIHEHLEKQIGRKISKGVISYHLALLLEGGVLNRELDRNPKEKTYSRYSIADYAWEKLEALDLLIKL